ncbi:hypothetical protein [uncultured Tateyamaria sp.]|uniref:hypothetical protein n=1 Tax=uncultured Tateyamaria sp. TaxID=455651 RepID=UPI00261AAB6D|nr:hypothetical protein [uncultured Tateyamaria sp.]
MASRKHEAASHDRGGIKNLRGWTPTTAHPANYKFFEIAKKHTVPEKIAVLCIFAILSVSIDRPPVFRAEDITSQRVAGLVSL